MLSCRLAIGPDTKEFKSNSNDSTDRNNDKTNKDDVGERPNELSCIHFITSFSFALNYFLPPQKTLITHIYILLIALIPICLKLIDNRHLGIIKCAFHINLIMLYNMFRYIYLTYEKNDFSLLVLKMILQ